jgi:hypothetical protein
VAEVTGWGTHDVAKETTRVGDILNAKRMRREHPFMVEDVKTHGVREPIYQDPDTGKLWDGHHRVAAALDAGLTHVPVLKKRRPV